MKFSHKGWKPLACHRLSWRASLASPPIGLLQIINGKRGITGDSALRLAHWFGDTPQFWMSLQVQSDLELAEAESGLAIRALPTGPVVRGHKAHKQVKTA